MKMNGLPVLWYEGCWALRMLENTRIGLLELLVAADV